MWTLCFLFSFFLSSGSIVSWGQAQRLGRRENEVRQVVEEENKRGGWKEDRREGWKADSGFLYEAGSVCFICLQLISASVTLSVYLRTFITCANSTERERESGHSADLSTSPEEISSTQGAFTLPKALTSNYLFFFFVQHSMQSSKKASAGVVCLMSLNAALLCCFPPLHFTHPSFLFFLPHPLFWLCLWPFSYSFPPWEDLVLFPSN